MKYSEWISHAIESSQAIIVLLSCKPSRSEAVAYNVKLAMHRGLKIIPVYIEKVDLS